MAHDPSASRAALTRRAFLGAATAGSVALATTSPIEASESRSDYDVIIIGAGFCGVTAARECRRLGYRTLLLEARNRAGGRTFTVPFNGKPVDVGGMWIHWSQPYVWTEWRRSGLPLEETMGASADRLLVHTSHGERLDLSFEKMGSRLEAAIAAYMGDTRTALPQPHDPFASEAYRTLDGLSSRERLDSLKGMSPLYRDLVDAYVAGCGHNRSTEFAYLEMARWYALAGHNYTDLNDASGRFHLRDGTVSLLNAMLAEGGAELRLGTPVRRVEADGSGAAVVTARGETLHARAVISTVPLNVLRDIEWEPGLSAERVAASKLGHAGHGTKVHVLLEGDLGNFTTLAPSQFALNSVFTEGIEDSKTHLVGFGPDPALLDVNDRDSVQEAVRLFLPSARVLECFGYEWTLDPYSKGTWGTLRPHMWSRYLRALQVPAGRIIFASADWANGWRGFIDGAIEQGLLAAQRTRALLA